MADQVVWSPQALEDVDAIAAYIARDSVKLKARLVYLYFPTHGKNCYRHCPRHYC